MDFFVSQVVTISPCVTNTQYALANKCSSLSFSYFSLNFPSFIHFLFRSLSYTISFALNHSPFHTYPLHSFFLLFTLMRGLKSSNKVCLLKNSSYSAFLLPRPRLFFLFFSSIYLSFFLFLTLSLSRHRDVPK